MKGLPTFTLLGLLFFAPMLTAAQSENAGFVDGLWYSEDTFFAGETVRIYVAIRNNTGAELSGTVTFYDNDDVIARKAINALNERIVESWADWTPSYGEHTLRAELSRLELSTVGADPSTTEVTANLARDILFVDLDTDGDGIGNTNDLDDDGDKVSDETEIAAGTDPLVFNKPAVPEAANDQPSTGTAPDDEDHSSTTSHKQPGGLEQFLTPSRADTVLTGITAWTDATKKKVDDYREERALKEAIATNDPTLEVNSDGFGEIVRSTDTSAKRPVAEKPTGFFGDLISLLGIVLSGLYTALLASLSFTLSYPMLIQLLLLVGTLYLIYRLAKHFGQRPN